jgi:catechol 2,3-dioxygenase-like lactoylglutathione lyase family enzyme
MIDHVSIGVRDLDRAKRFYDATLEPLGYYCLSESDDTLGYGQDTVAFWIYESKQPVDPNPASGLHFSFAAPTRESVSKFHSAAIKAGGKENGKPGLRKDYGITTRLT